MKKCKVCDKEFIVQKGLVNYCSLKCRFFKSDDHKSKISSSMKNNEKVKAAAIRNFTEEKKNIFIKHNQDKAGISERVKKFYKENPEAVEKLRLLAKNKIFSVETKRKLSENAKKNKLGGHNSKMKYMYETLEGKVVYLQSSYEFEVAKNLDKNGIKWLRPESLNWVDELNKSHRYYPDFYLINYNVFLDSKNDYLIKKDQNKINQVIKQNNVKILVLNKNQLTWESIKTLLYS